MTKYYAQVNAKEEDIVIRKLVSILGMPQIIKRLNLYSRNKSGQEAQLYFNNKQLFFKLKNDEIADGFVPLRNKKIKYFINYLTSLGFETASIRTVDALEFPRSKVQVTFLKDTFVGDLLEISVLNPSDGKLFFRIKEIIDSFGIKLINKAQIGKILDKTNIKTEKMFEKFGVLNEKIKQFSLLNGIDIRADSHTLKSRLEAINNDYSFLEESFLQVTGMPLLSEKSFLDFAVFKPISIVIPSYNSNQKLIYSLRSIQFQNIPATCKKKIQVIVIDDGSKEPVSNAIKNNGEKYDFELRVIRLEQNSDVSTARNVGISVAKNEFLLFIDADILLTKNYLMDCLIRMQLIPNAMFTSFRKNITSSSKILNQRTFESGLENNVVPDDSRIKSVILNDLIGWEERFDAGRKIELLDETDYFKNLSFGGNVGAYDLPRMLPSHNIAVNKSIVREIGGFSTEFKGWGLEDRYFAARGVANGNYIIPILSSCVYHIDYGPRDGDMKRKIREFKANFRTYKRLLQEEW